MEKQLNKKRILALDLGTKTGWAVNYELYVNNPSPFSSGMKDFSTKRFDGAGMRYFKFQEWLDIFLKNDFLSSKVISHPVEQVYFEEVLGHTGTAAAHVYGGFLATLMSWCEKHKIPYEGVPVKTIKKFITGKGNSDKNAVIESVIKRGYEVDNHDEADAIALLLCVEQRKMERG